MEDLRHELKNAIEILGCEIGKRDASLKRVAEERDESMQCGLQLTADLEKLKKSLKTQKDSYERNLAGKCDEVLFARILEYFFCTDSVLFWCTATKKLEGEYATKAHDLRRALNLKVDELEKAERDAQDVLAKAKEMRAGADYDTLQAIQSTKVLQNELTELRDAVTPMLQLIPGGEDQTLVEQARSASTRLSAYVKEMAWTIVRGLMMVIKMNIPNMDPRRVIKSPRDATADEFAAAEAEVQESAHKYADRCPLPQA